MSLVVTNALAACLFVKKHGERRANISRKLEMFSRSFTQFIFRDFNSRYQFAIAM